MTQRPPPSRPQPSLDGYHLPGDRLRAGEPPDLGGASPGPDLPRVVRRGDAGDVRTGARRTGGGRAGGGGPEVGPRRSRLWGALFYVGLAMLAVLVFAGAFLVGAPPEALIAARLAEAVKASTGRDLVIAGRSSFKFLPSLGVVMRDVTLSAPPGMGGGPTARIGTLEAGVRLAPLLQRRIEIERLVVRDAVVDLRVDAQGRRSWQFTDAAGAGGRAPTRYAQMQLAGVANDAARGLPAEARDFLKNAEDERVRNGGAGGGAAVGRLRDIVLGDVRLVNSTLTYADERTGKRESITAINAALTSHSADSPLDVAGNLVVERQRIDFDGRLASLGQLLAEQPAKLVFNAAAAPVKASFDGTVQVKEAVDLTGAFALTAPSARGLAAWAGTELPPSEGFGPLAVKGTLRAAGKSLAFSDASFELDGARATGVLSVVSGGPRPAIKANLQVSALDLDKYLADGPAGAASARPASATAAGGAPAAAAQPQSIEDLLKDGGGEAKTGAPAGAAGPAVKGWRRSAGWSEEPIRLASLGLADVDASLGLGGMTVHGLAIGASRIRVALSAANLKATIEDMALYDGHARGLVTVDGSGPTPRLTASLAADGLAMRPLLKDAADIDWLSGTGKLQLALAGTGQTEKQIVDGLSGTASLDLGNGAVAGFNLPGILRGLSQGRLDGLQRVPTEKTDFSQMSASFTVESGVASNQDLAMSSPLLRVGGSGRIMLGARQIDYTARPKIVGSVAGQGGGLELAGLEVPVRIHGSWDAPEFTPDLQGALKSSAVQEVIKDPSKAVEAAKRIGKQLGGKKAGALLRDLLGGD